MTSASAERQRLATERWQNEPHSYDCQYPRYPCGRCGLWPGHPLHRADAESSGTRVTVVPEPALERTE